MHIYMFFYGDQKLNLLISKYRNLQYRR